MIQIKGLKEILKYFKLGAKKTNCNEQHLSDTEKRVIDICPHENERRAITPDPADKRIKGNVANSSVPPNSTV